jgi:hypothetical protein
VVVVVVVLMMMVMMPTPNLLSKEIPMNIPGPHSKQN